MIVQVALLVAAALAAVTIALVCLLVSRRARISRRERREGSLDAEMAPLALELVDGAEVSRADDLDRERAEALARVLGRYSRQLSAEVREEIGSFFERAGFVDRQLELLRDRRAWRRGRAARSLGEMGSRRAVPALIGALGDSDPDVRAQAASSLGMLDAEEATAPIIRLLAAGELPRSVGGSTLISIGPGVVPALRGLLGGEDERVRAASAELLGILGGPADVDRLGAALRDPSAEVRARACRAIARVGGEEYEDVLRGLLRDRIGFVRAAAASALRAAGDHGAVELLIEQARHDEFEPAAAAAGRALAALAPTATLAAAARGTPGRYLLEAADRVAEGVVE